MYRANRIFLDDNEIDFKKCISYLYVVDKNRPDYEFSLDILNEKIKSEIVKVSFYRDSKLLFDGIVDSECKTNDNHIIHLSGRNRIGTMLLENEANIGVFDSVNMNYFVAMYGELYGIKKVLSSNNNKNIPFTISNGMSRWDIFKNFANQCYLEDIFLDIDGTLYIGENFDRKNFVFDEKKADINYFDFKEKLILKNQISTIASYSNDGTYDTYENKKAKREKRVILNKQTRWGLLNRISEKKIISDSMKSSKMTSISYFGNRDVCVHDRIRIADKEKTYVVSRVELEFYGKLVTTLYLEEQEDE